LIVIFIDKKACSLDKKICANISKKHAKKLQPQLHMKKRKKRRKMQTIL